jgi:hypothetical protein
LLKEPVESEDEQQSAESSNEGFVYELDSSNSDSQEQVIVKNNKNAQIVKADSKIKDTASTSKGK